ncbi:MAG TPA: TolC family protein, partial [Thermoanaerobaculia bacterium]|nr:TolC family protein [Thermoanaerobaculia bacterium]
VDNLLFDWGSTGLRIEQQQLETENLRLSYELQRRTLTAALDRLRGDIRSTIGQIGSIARTLVIAEDNYALTKAQYAGGGTTALEVLSAEQLLAESRLAALQSRAELRRLIARLEQLTAQ